MDKNPIYNFKKQNSFIKGDFGEIIIKNKVNYAHRTRELSFDFIKNSKLEIDDKIKDYLKEYWYTIDIFTFITDGNKVKSLQIYEVKVNNYYHKDFIPKYPKPSITSNSMKAYKEALNLGFIVKFANVILFDNWRYTIKFKDFKPSDFVIQDGSPYFSKIKKKDW